MLIRRRGPYRTRGEPSARRARNMYNIVVRPLLLRDYRYGPAIRRTVIENVRAYTPVVRLYGFYNVQVLGVRERHYIHYIIHHAPMRSTRGRLSFVLNMYPMFRFERGVCALL